MRTPTGYFRTARSVALLFPLVIVLLALSAQSQSAASPAQSPGVPQASVQPPLQIDVASIRPHQSAADEPSNRQILPGGRFVATATSVRTLIRVAFGIDDHLISGAPSWIDNETFDINATTVNRAEVITPQQFQELILSLLEDRFEFKFHRAEKEAAVYRLELVNAGKPGPALKPSTPASQPNMSTNSNGSRTVMKASKMSMADIAATLRRPAGRPVEDHTDLKGDFDFQIEWAPEETVDASVPSLFTVLKERLGLKLRPAKGMVETLIIDQISHPSAN